jgi:hypothetical protein
LRRRSTRAAAAFAALALLAPAHASAQQGTRLQPSLAVVEVYDDNVFYTPEPTLSDWFTRVTPGLQLRHRSAPLILTARYDLDLDFLAQPLEAETPELDRRRARQEAALEVDARSAVFEYVGSGSYTETISPRELNLTTRFGAGLIEADRWATRHVGTLHVGALTNVVADYSFNRDAIVGEPPINIHVAQAGVERRLSPRNMLRATYSFRRYLFDFSERRETAHAVLLGWTHDLTPRTRIELAGGPRFSSAEGVDESSVRAEALVSVRHRYARGEVGVLVSRAQTTIVGIPGTVTTDHAALLLAHAFHPRVRLSLRPLVYRNTNFALDATVYLLDSGLSWTLSPWAALDVSYRRSLQQGGVIAFPFGDVSQNVLTVKVSASAR